MVTIDAHAHLAPPVPDGIAAVHSAGPADLYSPEALIAWLDRVGIDAAAVSIPPPLYAQHNAPDEARLWVEMLNRGILEGTAERSRLLPLGYLPLEHPMLALDEAYRLASEGSVVGFVAAAGGRSVPLDAEELAPLWDFIVDADLPMLLHPGESPDDRLHPYYLKNLLGNPVETGVAVAQLLFGGVLSSRPKLRIAVVHCGGILPSVAGRWRQGIRTTRPGVSIDVADFDRALRCLWIDTIAHDDGLLQLAARVVGRDRILLGSDWPFAMGSQNPLDDIRLLGAEVQRQLPRNTEDFFGTQVVERLLREKALNDKH